MAGAAAARLDPDDIAEDAAASRLGAAVAGPGLRVAEATTGRCNLYAETPGVPALTGAPSLPSCRRGALRQAPAPAPHQRTGLLRLRGSPPRAPW